MDMMRSKWPVSIVSSLEQMGFITMNPTPEMRLPFDGFLEKKSAKQALSCWRLHLSAKRNSLKKCYVNIDVGTFMCYES